MRFVEKAPVCCDVDGLTNVQVYLDDCADVFVSLAQNTSMTGQDIIVGEFVPHVPNHFGRSSTNAPSDAGLKAGMR